MYNDIPAELRQIVEPVVKDHGLELVDAGISRGQGRTQVTIVLDTPQGDGLVKADQCAAVSREVASGLDAIDLVPEAYMLEVTSPGVDRTLAREVDFERVVGRKVAIETREPVAGRRRFKGELLTFDDAVARIRIGDDDFAIPFADIRKGKAFYPFDSLPKQSRR